MKFLMMFLVSVFGVFFTASGQDVLRDQSGNQIRYGGRFDASPVILPKTYDSSTNELRGVWIATVENLDFDKCKTSGEFIKAYGTMIRELAKKNVNAVFFQIRPNNDAFYPSKFNPYSRWMTGSEGVGYPGFDPLAFMIAETKRHGMEFHAWLNPYRIIKQTKLTKDGYLNTLATNNFARRNPHLVLTNSVGNRGEIGLYLNPGEPAVVKHILNTINEIISKYPIDAVHFDDYFYPYSGINNSDSMSHRRYGKGQDIHIWRKGNVTKLVQSVNNLIKIRTKGKVKFGISPFGIWANKKTTSYGSLTGGKESLTSQYADTRAWVKNNYIDYIVPQLYWPFGHDVAAYAVLTDWWAEQVRGTRVKLYIGMGLYNMGTSPIWQDFRELSNQMRYNSKHPEIKGSVIFRGRLLISPTNKVMQEGVNDFTRKYWSVPSAKKYPQFK